MFNKEEARQHVDALLKHYDITVEKWSVRSCGYANWKKRSVKIPHPTDADRFSVCVHEIKHIIDGDWGYRFEQEFACDLFALNVCIDLEYDTDLIERRMRWHCLSRIAMATNRGLKAYKISQEIKDYFSDVDFTLWEGKKVWVECNTCYENFAIFINKIDWKRYREIHLTKTTTQTT